MYHSFEEEEHRQSSSSRRRTSSVSSSSSRRSSSRRRSTSRLTSTALFTSTMKTTTMTTMTTMMLTMMIILSLTTTDVLVEAGKGGKQKVDRKYVGTQVFYEGSGSSATAQGISFMSFQDFQGTFLGDLLPELSESQYEAATTASLLQTISNGGLGPVMACFLSEDSDGYQSLTNLADLNGLTDDARDVVYVDENTQLQTCVTFASTLEALEKASKACASGGLGGNTQNKCKFVPFFPASKVVEGTTDFIYELAEDQTHELKVELVTGLNPTLTKENMIQLHRQRQRRGLEEEELPPDEIVDPTIPSYEIEQADERGSPDAILEDTLEFLQLEPVTRRERQRRRLSTQQEYMMSVMTSARDLFLSVVKDVADETTTTTTTPSSLRTSKHHVAKGTTTSSTRKLRKTNNIDNSNDNEQQQHHRRLQEEQQHPRRKVDVWADALMSHQEAQQAHRGRNLQQVEQLTVDNIDYSQSKSKKGSKSGKQEAIGELNPSDLKDECLDIYQGIKMTPNYSKLNQYGQPMEMTVSLKSTKDLLKQHVNMKEKDIKKCVVRMGAALCLNPHVSKLVGIPKTVELSQSMYGSNELHWVTQKGCQKRTSSNNEKRRYGNDVGQCNVDGWSSDSKLKPFFNAGIDGSGVIVGISDTGIDTKSCYFSDAALSPVYSCTSSNSNHRKIVQYCPRSTQLVGIGNTNVVMDDANDGHGTAVASVIAGARRNGNGGYADGMAPGAKLVVYDIQVNYKTGEDASITIDPNFDEMIFGKASSTAGARLHNISWGTSHGRYISYDQTIDSYLEQNKDELIVVSAGNVNAASATIGSPAFSKNAIVVGATHSGGSNVPSDNYGPDYLWEFSRVGPTYGDQRMKPDLVAPGYSILTARSKPLAAYDGGRCAIDERPDLIVPPNEAVHELSYRQGTSFAAPAVTGAAALLTQYYKQKSQFLPSGSETNLSNGQSPSGALLKATLLNGAQPLKGVTDNSRSMNSQHRGFDAQQGFGRLYLSQSVPLKSNSDYVYNLLAKDRMTIQRYTSHRYRLKIINKQSCTASDLSATLVWMDPAGASGCMSCHYNDLDLIVQRPNTSQRSWGNDVYGQNLKDFRNNVERVRFGNIGNNGSYWDVIVQAPNLVTTTQDYALVVTGCFEKEFEQIFDTLIV